VIGRSIGNYKIVRILGEGGMGTVYLAEHPMIGKRVAVKMLRPDLGEDPGLVSRFFQEAKAVNEIRHPSIVDISDFGHTEDGIVYFVMELLEGQSLRDRLATQGPMPIAQAVATARQVVDALAAAHRVGIIHRDLKPDNIFLITDAQTPGGFRTKLFDFGVAKLVGEKQLQVGHKTIDGAVVGTPFYMSPEQALCQDVTAAADIYAMGVVMYEMVTGTVPFRAEQLVLLLNAILKEPAPPPSRVRAEVPPWLDRLILRCLEKDPGARPRSMEEVHAALAAGEGSSTGVALGATLVAPSGMAAGARPSAVGKATMAQVSGSGAISAVRDGVAAPSASATLLATLGHRQTAIRGGVARSTESMGVVTRVRAYLDTSRVQRVAIALFVLTALVVVGSVFLSSTSTRPVSAVVPAAEPPPAVQHASVHLNSEPAGAEVLRLNDNRLLGTTPVVDIRPVDGRQINYRFRLAGYTDVQMPFRVAAAGRHEVAVTLSSVDKGPDSEARGSSSGRRSGRSHERKSAKKTTTVTVGPRRMPVEQPAVVRPDPVLPPLGERNPVRRLGR